MNHLLAYAAVATIALGVACAIACCGGNVPYPKGGSVDTRDGGSVTVFFQRADAGD